MLPITFLSDYGHRDEYVGVCHGVIERVAPGATVIDLVHGVPARDVRAGALALRKALPYLPKGIHLAVVDPGVGSDRRALAVRAHDGRHFVGPDNGLLWPALERSGGIEVAVDIADSPFRLEPVSATFHGRDLFAPIAARLALEAPIESVGSPVPPDELVRLQIPEAALRTGAVGAVVLSIDGFGNLELNVTSAQMREAGFSLGDALSVEIFPTRRWAKFGRTFVDAPVDEAVVYENSSGMVEVAINGGIGAAAVFTAAPGDQVELTPWRD